MSVVEVQLAPIVRSTTTLPPTPAVLYVPISLPIVAPALIRLFAFLARTLSSYRQTPHAYLVPQ